MRNVTRYLIVILFLALSAGGCANLSYDAGAFAGIGIKDLEKAREKGPKKVFRLSYDAAFDRMMGIIKSNGLIAYQSNRKKGYIVVMGFPRQTHTTRVGIFFDDLGDGTTRITLSSLSRSCLIKGESIFFGKIEGDVVIVE
jgi:hypothetical protein